MTTTYSHERLTNLKAERTRLLGNAKAVLASAKAAGRDLDSAEDAAMEASMARVRAIDVEAKDQSTAMVSAVLDLGGSDDGDADSDRFMSLRRNGTKSRLASRAGEELTGRKALNVGPEQLVTVELDAQPYTMGRPPTSLLEILPTVKRGPVFRWMQQTTRTNNAAPVAPGGLKPTSVYTLTPIDGRLKVLAHISEPVDTYMLKDGPSLVQFVGDEMLAGLHDAVETSSSPGPGSVRT